MIIPHSELAPDTLYKLVEEFVTRDGTDYGEHEISIQQKIAEVIHQLERGVAFISYSELNETCTIISKQDLDRE